MSNDLRLCETEKQNILEELNRINNSLFSAKEIIGDNFPDDEYWALEDEKLQKTSPWNFSDLHEIRAKIFIEALNLHKIFILYNREKIANTLRAARQVIAEGKLLYDKMHLIPHIWETFHLTVPVVSTTFASFSKLFKGMGNNTIGWLLIDEAGQAMPQITAGALFRAKRAMIVGDPLQIEPAVTIPEVMSLVLRKYFKVSNSWDPYNQSVQTLADRANPIGTVLQSGGKENSHWVGAPLRVHRRCNDPMFTLSNSIVYDNLMIYASNNKPLQVDLKLSDSLWAHVTLNGESKNNWSKPEGEVAFDFLKHINKLNDKVINLRSTFVISPFKNMKQGFRKLLNEDLAYKKLFNNKVEFNRWMKTNVGTAHTFQGKEAEIVIFILGGSSKRALQWASKNPNLLNVALTRAKRAIYIIGDFHIWSKMNYFNQLAGSLPIKPYNEKLLPYKKGGQSS
ncbi:DEAD/DEAH box helicase [endosymbiont of Acanthamoeba sp. UWC8]|uniref:DEAD/DEAH box helicase n=1 Tax=endosymbiont of Acanthamoeba sp. UWC8 TaxID=86106 RepID=UPI00056FDB4D|nr:DEAD/DEAH box helicase [endosymbiont of Acanthamoeba sp. UWC8]